MSDLSSDFDARRIGWWARRSAVRRIRRSTTLTEADRELRVQQAQAAQTRGEVNALTRGLSVTAPAPRQWTPPRASAPPPLSPPGLPPAYTPPPSPQQPSSWTPPAQRVPVPQPFSQQPPARKTLTRRHLVIGLVILMLLCGGGLVSCVSAVVDSVQDASSSSAPAPAPDPQTENGWNDMIYAFSDETDLGTAVGVTVRRRSATLSVEAGDTESSRYYFDGDVTPASEVGRGPGEQVFDLADIDGAVVAEAVARARRASGYPESDEAWVQVWAGADGPRIAVTFPTAGADAYALVVDSFGLTVSETS